MEWINQYLSQHDITKRFINQSSDFAHLSTTQEAMLYIGSYLKTGKSFLVIKENEVKANELYKEISKIMPDLDVIYYNHEESLRVEAIVQSEIMRADRVNSLYKILKNEFDICITHGIAASRKISSPEILKNKIMTLNLEQEIEPDVLQQTLIKMGYSKVKYVDKPFTFAKRGGIFDVYSIQMDDAVRIEFFDIEVESIRKFDIETQRSTEKLESVEIVFANDIILSDEEINMIDHRVTTVLQETKDETLIHHVEMKLEGLKSGLYEASIYPLLGVWDSYATILDYFKDSKVYLSPYDALMRNIKMNREDAHEFMEEQVMMGEMIYFENIYDNFEESIQAYQIQKIGEFQSEDEVHIPWHAAEIVSENIEDTMKWLKKEAITQKVIMALNEKNMEHFINILLKHQIAYQIINEKPKKTGIYIEFSDIEKGFILDDEKIVVYTENELANFTQKSFRYDNKFLKAETLTTLQDLNLGDYVVHRQYGIGRYMGIHTKEIEGVHKDFMRVLYKDEDELFIPLEQFSLVRKFLSSEAASVRLSKLGSGTWEKNKARIKADVADVADRLVSLYSSRLESKGHAFSKDTEYQKQFEAEFPFDLTRDQETSIQEIKKDMESSLPMDRLLIGDVGFGKTEVAIRASFKAFTDSKQVIFLCPTTILSAQHGRTFKERFKNYPINIAVINRFVSAKKQKEMIKDFKEGKIDVLIGTHRVLSRDVKAKDLGLLVIDEEQRFGVEHKERIKEFKVSVDVLSLSATPIPRTLQMSLVGLRSLSQLNTPPRNRLPVMTYVIEKNQKTLYDIISKELSRNGQVFYLYNNVEALYPVATSIGMHIKEAKVGIIHGQMDRNQIEDVMMQFIAKEFNVLVCTTIIETGIDIPNANTIIVDQAQKFGLSQLYQIKGRVGRSDRLAYAYFVVPAKKSLTEVAQKRLQAIKEFTQLGSGYKIAMRDLTIRGAGELLGGNQSGFIDTVGMDLYVELLKEAIAKRQGEIIEKVEEKEVFNLKMDGYLPEAFTSDEGETLELYQQINEVKTISQLKSLTDMINDRYGKLPNAVLMLLEKTRLEIFLADDRIESFKERASGVELVFTAEYTAIVDGIKLFELVSSRSSAIKIKYIRQTIIITMPMYQEWAEDLLFILENMKEIKQDETR